MGKNQNLIWFNLQSFLIFSLLFTIEVVIAFYVKQHFIRFVFGDFLIVIMLYYFLKSFLKVRPLYLALAVLLFAYFVEFIQLTNFLEILSLEDNTLAKLIFGNTFSIGDLIAYTLGIITVLIIEKKQPQ